MNYINELLSNRIFVVSACSWAAAQILKTIINFVFTKQFKAERLVGAGGMPSAHSAFVCALMVSTAKQYGLSSPFFSIAFALAAVVMYDAMGVRHAAGEQAKAINTLINEFEKQTSINIPYNLKEFLGHTPLEVIAGAILGIFMGITF